MGAANSFVVLYNALLIEDEDKRIQTLRHLIDNGVNVNSCWNMKCKSMPRYESEGLTVLMVAARYGYADCVQVLLDAGAKVNQSDYVICHTALIEAASAGHVECMRLLLEAGADVDQSDRLGKTALMTSASDGYVECARLLLEAGANVNGVDTTGNTTLIHFLNCYSDKDKACLKLLIDAGADIDVRNNNKHQPIHYALKLWKMWEVEYLISENCNLSQVSYNQVKACIDENLFRKSFKLDLNDRLDMLKLLFACGLPRHLWQSFTVEQDTSVRTWIKTVASQPNTLKSTCIFKIRRNLGLGIKSKVTKLNLPNVIQNLILLKGILISECYDINNSVYSPKLSRYTDFAERNYEL